MSYQLQNNLACNAMEDEHARQTGTTMHKKIIVECYIQNLRLKFECGIVVQ